MSYRDLFKSENMEIRERFDLSMERAAVILQEHHIKAPFEDYFKTLASFVLMIEELVLKVEREELKEESFACLKSFNQRLYGDITNGRYETSYANPAYAVSALGKDLGGLLCFLYTEIRGMIVYAYECRLQDITICCEVLIEIYNRFEEERLPEPKDIRQIIYWFVSDYSDITLTYRIREQLDPALDFALNIINHADFKDLRYLYQFGEYITENELRTAQYLNSMPQKEIDDMASTFTEGYRLGFLAGNIDLKAKETVNIRFSLGFERIIRKAVQNFADMGLKTVIYRSAVNSINKKQQHKIGYSSTSPNKQYDYDHRADSAIYLDKAFVERKLGVLRTGYENCKYLASKHAGPAVMEIFGELPFVPVSKAESFHLDERQQKLAVAYDNEAAQIINEYIPGDERSFTIIAYPIPEIGPDYEEIFDEIVKINTLDYKLYERIQQKMINALDQGVSVRIKGSGANRTDLRVQLHRLEDKEKHTNFENCVADVNIPVGEVFTSPQLAGTCGVLHVGLVYLNELAFKDLCLVFKDGMVSEYSCGNFEDQEENRSYVKENVFYNHETLPLGEFAIGTNTTAYVMAARYRIADKLPILIAEKMGPHFAVGDTCYSRSEDKRIYNSDGREITAKDNEISALRKEDPGKAYFNCHTDITIPYEELEHLTVVKEDGSELLILKDGRFVLKGTEELNLPLDAFDWKANKIGS